MTTLVVEYGPEASKSTVATVAELDALLDGLEAEAAADVRPWWIVLYDIEGTEIRSYLAMGVGGPFSFLTWADEQANTGANSVGDADTGDVPAWLYSGAYSEIESDWAIPNELAREAAREYLRSGQQPTNVTWQR